MYHSFIQLLSCVQLFLIPWTVVHQAPPSMGFPRQEYSNGLSFPSPGDLPNPGIKSESPALVGRFFITEPPRKPRYIIFTADSHFVRQKPTQHCKVIIVQLKINSKTSNLSIQVIVCGSSPYETWK